MSLSRNWVISHKFQTLYHAKLKETLFVREVTVALAGELFQRTVAVAKESIVASGLANTHNNSLLLNTYYNIMPRKK